MPLPPMRIVQTDGNTMWYAFRYLFTIQAIKCEEKMKRKQKQYRGSSTKRRCAVRFIQNSARVNIYYFNVFHIDINKRVLLWHEIDVRRPLPRNNNEIPAGIFMNRCVWYRNSENILYGFRAEPTNRPNSFLHRRKSFEERLTKPQTYLRRP